MTRWGHIRMLRATIPGEGPGSLKIRMEMNFIEL